MKGLISMSVKESERISVMDDLINKRVKQKHASLILGVSTRQVRRLLKRYRAEGTLGLVHKGRGKISNRAILPLEKEKAAKIIAEKYPDFGPTLAHEKLCQNYKINFSDETIRQIMISQNLWQPQKRSVEDIHPYRERRACPGELVQLDGSFHHWFENRAPACTLLGFIDDATSQMIHGRFVDYEGTFQLFGSMEEYLLRFGKPLALYVDRHSTFKINRQATIEEELRDKTAMSQFQRAMDELNIELIFALSPQAKGRVERLFGTLQDRLVKEMRLLNISTISEANKFLKEVYISKHNARFSVLPKDKTNMHRPLLPFDDLARIFTMQSKRMVSRNLAVQYKNSKYQLLPEKGYRYSLRNSPVVVYEKEDGSMTFRFKDKNIPFTRIIENIHLNKPIYLTTSKNFLERRVNIPNLTHPWRQRCLAIT